MVDYGEVYNIPRRIDLNGNATDAEYMKDMQQEMLAA